MSLQRSLQEVRKRPLLPGGGNDKIYTPDALARDLVQHFKPSGRVLEPCAGDGAFLRVLPDSDWFEIDKDRDFLEAKGHWDWIITNPPYGNFRAFLRKSMTVADNVVFLCLYNAWFLRARQRDIKSTDFGLVEICECPVPPKPWPQFGVSLGAGWLRRGWKGSTHFSTLNSSLWTAWNRQPDIEITNPLTGPAHNDSDPLATNVLANQQNEMHSALC